MISKNNPTVKRYNHFVTYVNQKGEEYLVDCYCKYPGAKHKGKAKWIMADKKTKSKEPINLDSININKGYQGEQASFFVGKFAVKVKSKKEKKA